MTSKRITPDEAALYSGAVIDGIAGNVQSVDLSQDNQNTHKKKSVLDTPFARITGLGYKGKMISTVAGAFKDVEKEKLKEIMTGPDRLDKKIGSCLGHIADKTSSKAVVAAGMYFAKSLPAMGVAMAVSSVAPIAAAACGYIAYRGVKWGAAYFLTTHYGHNIEMTMADKVKQGYATTKGFLRAASGKDPEYGQMHEISQQMEKTLAHDAHHDHSHAHEHHHESFLDTLKKDVGATLDLFRKPKEAMKAIGNGAKHAIQDFSDTHGIKNLVASTAFFCNTLLHKTPPVKLNFNENTMGMLGRDMPENNVPTMKSLMNNTAINKKGQHVTV